MVIGATLSGQSFGGDLLSRLLGGKGCGASSSCCDTSVCDPSCGAEMAPCGSGCGPSCGAEIAAPCGSGCGAGPSCGAEIAAPCGPSCAPSCGAEMACAPACAPTSCCNVRTPILDALKGMKGQLKCKLTALKAKKSCAPSCGAEVSCDPCGSACGPTCGAEIAAPCGSGCAPTCGAEISACDPCAAPACDSGCGCGSRKIGGGLLSKIFSHKKSSCCDSGCATACDAAPAGCSSCGSSPVSAPSAAPVATPAPVVDPHAYLNTKRHVIQASSTRIR